jgi:mutator protein MutT
MTEVVCGVIRNEDGWFLACLRPQGKHLGGQWEFPGGKVETGESHEAALIRELREELGVEVAVGNALQPVRWTYDRGEICLLPYLCVISGGNLHPHEHERICWCAPGDFAALDWAAADLPILDQLRQQAAGAITP